MRICIPVGEDNGLESKVWAHFGSAPGFMIVDTESGSWQVIPNRNQHHAHGMCMPLASLQGEQLDAIAVGGIGAGALNKLMAADIRVYSCDNTSVAQVVADLKAGTLKLMQPNMVCGGHGLSHL
ncbi:MAG: diguanylate cyclase [Acidobacteria bacterium]|nr:MAG: diguanylate cyclase [Acidobacteriota bacterium]